MARKFLDKDGLTALWAKIVDKINSLGDSLASVAFSGSYNDLSNKPTIPDVSGKVNKSGDTMSGQLKTSFKESVAMGSFHSPDATLPDFCNAIRFSSGATGSVVITNDYTQNGVTVVNGWYNFFYSPHRSGGVNGESSGDNCNYGTLILSAMTSNRNPYIIRITGASPYISNIYKVTVENDVAGKVSKTGDTMSGKLTFSNTTRNIEVPARAVSYVSGAQGNAALYVPATYNADAWYPAVCVQTKGGGSWQIGNYNNECLDFVNFTKANIDAGKNEMQGQFRLEPNGSFTAPKTCMIADGSIICKSPAMPANPTSGSTYLNGLYLRDNANDDYCYIRAHSSSTEKGMQIEVRRSINGSYVYNTLNMRINESGTKTVQVSDAAAWRSAIGAQGALSVSDVSYTRKHASVSNDFKVWRWGNVVTIGGYFSCGATIAANTVLWDGLPKPKNNMFFTWQGYDFNLRTDGAIRTNGQIIAKTYNVALTYVCT